MSDLFAYANKNKNVKNKIWKFYIFSLFLFPFNKTIKYASRFNKLNYK